MARKTPKFGSIAWHDLTVKDADSVAAFYRKVLGWRSKKFEGDFNMFAGKDATPVAGVCHATGANATLPPQWLAYVLVQDLDKCLAQTKKHGGTIVVGPRELGTARMAVIRDPAGAYLALFFPG
jgi:hypothetical protein